MSVVAIPVRTIRRIGSTVQGALWPERQLRKRREYWRTRWGSSDYKPFFHPGDNIQPELLEAVETKWFPPAGKVLDIGCGDGWVAAWLADKGFDVLGVDFAEGAIERAKKTYPPEPKKIDWRVVDILGDDPPRNNFDAMIDRGCLHRIPEHQWPKYRDNVRACVKPGAGFLLIFATFKSDQFQMCDSRMTYEQVESKVKAVFESAFSIDRMEHGYIELTESSVGNRITAVVFWMTARD